MEYFYTLYSNNQDVSTVHWQSKIMTSLDNKDDYYYYYDFTHLLYQCIFIIYWGVTTPIALKECNYNIKKIIYYSFFIYEKHQRYFFKHFLSHNTERNVNYYIMKSSMLTKKMKGERDKKKTMDRSDVKGRPRSIYLW